MNMPDTSSHLWELVLLFVTILFAISGFFLARYINQQTKILTSVIKLMTSHDYLINVLVTLHTKRHPQDAELLKRPPSNVDEIIT